MPITDGDKMAAWGMATAMCGKVQSTPVDYVRIYFEMLEKCRSTLRSSGAKVLRPDDKEPLLRR